MWHAKIAFICLFLISLVHADTTQGKVLFHEASCLECHNYEDFGSEASKIKMFKALEARVQACQLSQSDELFDEEVHDIAKYLNKDFYKLKK